MVVGPLQQCQRLRAGFPSSPGEKTLARRGGRSSKRAEPFPSFSAPSINPGDPEPTEECITKPLWLEAGSEACEVFRIGD
jgi:hypothetical protein